MNSGDDTPVPDHPHSVYLVREKQGHPSASKLRAEIIAADPDGILAARSSKPAAKKKKAR